MCFPRLQKQGTLASSFGIEPAGAITKHIQPVPITRYQSVLLHSQCWPEQNGLKLHSSLGLKNADPYPYRKTLLGNGISSKFMRFFHQSIWINYNIQPECRPFGGSCPLQVQTLLSSAFAQWGRDGIYPGDPKSNQISYDPLESWFIQNIPLSHTIWYSQYIPIQNHSSPAIFACSAASGIARRTDLGWNTWTYLQLKHVETSNKKS